MEPKDLKNSEELKRTENENQTNLEQEVSGEVENAKEEIVDAVESKIEAEAETEIAKAEESIADTIKEEPQKEEELEKTEPEAKEEKPVESEVEKNEESGEEAVVEKAVEPEAETKVEEKEPETVETKKKGESTTKAEEVTEPEEKVVAEDSKPEVKTAVAEKEAKTEREKVDYSEYSQVELVNALRDLVEGENDYDIRSDINVIKALFYKSLNEENEASRKKFVEEGGEAANFKAEENPYEKDIKNLFDKYRKLRIEYAKKQEEEKEDNLKRKYTVIEKIKGLINNEESINKTFNEFRELQKEWHEIGLIPQAKMKDLWDTYHFHVENFYDYIKINRELRDLDLRKNLEAKIKLCEKAEELLVEEPSIIRAFNTLQKFHDQWREIGPVPREQKDDLWERFKAATTKINKKHQEYFEERKVEQKKNLEAKTALCEKVEEINNIEISSHKEWDEKSKQIIELQKVWRTIGYAPRKDNNIIYERFRKTCDTFFNAKREFYAQNKAEQQNNLQLKTDLCLQAESLKDSAEWKETTQVLIDIQKKWKEIGPVPRKHSDSLWKRFRAACDHFFDKKSDHFSGVDDEQLENLKLKEQLITEIKSFEASEATEENLESLKNFQRRWTEIGHVPYRKKDELQSEYRDAINKLFDELNIDEGKRNMLKFRNKMSTFSETSRGQNKMRFERDKYMTKMKQLENDLVLLDNNIGFFAKSKNAESLIEDVKKKIEVTKQKIEHLKQKIRVIDQMDNEY